MRVAILGYGRQGQSAADYYANSGHEITICDKDASLKLPSSYQAKLGANHLENLDEFDLLVRSPIIHPRDIVAANSPEILEKVTSSTNEFFKACPTKNIIGVTGTKGKGTTSTLIAKMLEASGKKVHLGGNIGTPPLDLLMGAGALHSTTSMQAIQPDDYVVLELANFQLIDLKYSPHIAICLQVVEEHQDWHTDLDEYLTAKQQLFRWQKADDIAIFYAKNEFSTLIASAGKGQKLSYLQDPQANIVDNEVVIDGQTISAVSEIKLPGKHNWQNICAALTAVWQITQDVSACRSVITSLTALPFRIEKRATIKGIDFFNDSFATGPDATIAAIEALPQHKILILGGFDRGLNLGKLSDTLLSHSKDIRCVLLIGQSAARLSKVLQVNNFSKFIVEPSHSMEEILDHAITVAKPGDAILLSPGFASFDMFKNFEERGNAFNTAIENL